MSIAEKIASNRWVGLIYEIDSLSIKCQNIYHKKFSALFYKKNIHF